MKTKNKPRTQNVIAGPKTPQAQHVDDLLKQLRMPHARAKAVTLLKTATLQEFRPQ